MLTDANRDELCREVEVYAARSFPLFGDASAPHNTRTHAARAAWDALTPAGQARVADIERAQQVDRAARHAAFESAQVRDSRYQRLRDAGVEVTDAVERMLLDHELRDTDAIKSVRHWFERRQEPWMVLAGPVGCGKSVAAAAAVAYGPTALWLRSDALCRVFSSNYSEQRELQERVRTISLLVVDDLGAEPDPARMLLVLFDLLDARKSARRRPTIVTTNATRRALLERYPEPRLTSRLVESVQWFGLTGPDLRQEQNT
jgi:DNA replication protein DnaC